MKNDALYTNLQGALTNFGTATCKDMGIYVGKVVSSALNAPAPNEVYYNAVKSQTKNLINSSL